MTSLSFLSGCLLCRKQYTEPCPSHGLRYSSKEDNDFQRSRALSSLPPEVCLCVSSIPGAGFGVCTREHIPAGTWIGPFEGKRVQLDDVKPGTDSSYMWEVCTGSMNSISFTKSDQQLFSPYNIKTPPNTVEPLYNEIPGKTNDIFQPSNITMYVIESRCNSPL